MHHNLPLNVATVTIFALILIGVVGYFGVKKEALKKSITWFSLEVLLIFAWIITIIAMNTLALRIF